MDNVIAAMEANHLHLTTAKSFYVEISRTRDRAELVTDDAAALKERLEAVTGERISALDGIGEAVQREHEKNGKGFLDRERVDQATTAPFSCQFIRFLCRIFRQFVWIIQTMLEYPHQRRIKKHDS